MTNITWGPEIAVNRGKPAFAADDDVCAILACGVWCGSKGAVCVKFWTWHPGITAIRLPADHWAYPVIEKGFWPWAVGDKAPDDWDGGEVLLRDDSTWIGYCVWRQDVADNDIIGYRRRTDAPAVTGNSATFSEALDMVARATREKRLDAIRSLCADDLQAYVAPIGTRATVLHHGDARGGLIVGASLGLVYGEGDTPRTIFGERVDDTVTLKRMTPEEAGALWEYHGSSRDIFVSRLRHLGLIRDETPLERFARETNTIITDDNRAAIEAALAWSKDHV